MNIEENRRKMNETSIQCNEIINITGEYSIKNLKKVQRLEFWVRLDFWSNNWGSIPIMVILDEFKHKKKYEFTQTVIGLKNWTELN